MLSALIKALDTVETAILTQTLLPLIARTWPVMCTLLEKFSNDVELVLYVTTLL